MTTSYSAPSYWTDERRRRARDLNQSLTAHCEANGFGRTWIINRLLSEFDGLAAGQIVDWLADGCWDPVVLYRLCDYVEYPKWEAADAIGALPDNPESWIGRRMTVGTTFSVERYLGSKAGLQDRATAQVRADQVCRLLAERLPEHRVTPMVHERGTGDRRVPYHTYVAIRPPDGAEPPGSEGGPTPGFVVRCAVADALATANASTHWEPSSGCKPAGHRNDEVLIVESYFDNRPDDPNRTPPPSLETPVVLLGVYYSGVKDMSVLVADELGLGAFDVTRYVAQMLQDTQPFRREHSLQAQVFWNVIDDESLRDKLVLTIDDYGAITRDDAPLRRRWSRSPGTAVLLELDDAMLTYAATRIAANAPSRAVDVASCRRELTRAQAVLRKIARRFHQHPECATLTISNETVCQHPEKDQVDAMFDTYRTTATTIVRLLQR